MQSDLAVLNADFDSLSIDQIKDVESLLTILGGNIVYQSGRFQVLQQLGSKNAHVIATKQSLDSVNFIFIQT